MSAGGMLGEEEEEEEGQRRTCGKRERVREREGEVEKRERIVEPA